VARRLRRLALVARRLRRVALVLMSIATLAWVPATLAWVPATASAQAAPYCQADQSPAFPPDFAPLVSQLGAFMGAPIECPHRDATSGDLLQATSTGLAYDRSALNTPIFTDGDSHVAWTNQGLTGWDGQAVDAPLHLTLDNNYPTWCNAQAIGQGVNGYLCIYANQDVAAWTAAPQPGVWQLLGTAAGPTANWVLTAAGQVLLGGSMPTLPAPTQPVSDGVPPPDNDLELSLQPVSPSPPPSFPLLTGSVCNRSSVWTATNVQIDFAFYADALTPTPDHGSYTVASVPPNACQPFLASLSALYAWQTITPTIASVNWRR
jgi:hypothetical protein